MNIKNSAATIDLGTLITQEWIHRIDAKDRFGAIDQLVEKIAPFNVLQDPKEFIQAIHEREEIVSTGIGLEVAIPHAKLESIDHFFVAVGLLETSLNWDAIDEKPVSIIFLIGGPEGRQTEYLQILSQLTMAIKDEKKRKKILLAKNPTSVIDLFKGE